MKGIITKSSMKESFTGAIVAIKGEVKDVQKNKLDYRKIRELIESMQ